MRYEDLEIGNFFKLDEDSAITYQKRGRDSVLGRISYAYNTRTGKDDGVCYGVIHPVNQMTVEQIQTEQADNAMWGKLWVSHDEKLQDSRR